MGQIKALKYGIIVILINFANIISGCATWYVYEKKDGPHKVSISESGTFDQIYYSVIKLNNNKLYNVEKILCIPILVEGSKKYIIISNYHYDSISSANRDIDTYKSMLKSDVEIKSIEVINHKGKHRHGWYIYFTYDTQPNVSINKGFIYPNKLFNPGELIPDDIIKNNYMVTVNDRIKHHGTHYAYLVHTPELLKVKIEDKFDYRNYEKLLPDNNHAHTLNVMNSDAEYLHSAFFRYGMTPFSLAVDIATSPLQLLFFIGLNNSSIAN